MATLAILATLATTELCVTMALYFFNPDLCDVAMQNIGVAQSMDFSAVEQVWILQPRAAVCNIYHATCGMCYERAAV